MLRETSKSKYAILAMKYFKEGYNCAQSVVLAFSDQYDLPGEVAVKVVSGFGGGMGRLREVCGAVTGMFFVLSLKNGYTDPQDSQGKAEHYTRIRELAADFEETNHSIICRELLGLTVKNEEPTPEERTEEYYNKRPCEELIGQAAALLEEYLIKIQG